MKVCVYKPELTLLAQAQPAKPFSANENALPL